MQIARELCAGLGAAHDALAGGKVGNYIAYFPSYAPQLNPDEGVWPLAKRELANSCPNDVDELMEDILGTIDGIRNSQQKLRGCIAQSELTFSLR